MGKPNENSLPIEQGAHGVSKARQLNRRRFLKGTGAAAIGAVAIPPAVLMVQTGSAYAESFKIFDELTGNTLVRMARDIFPHDKIPDKFYVSAIAAYESRIPEDPEIRGLITNGVAQLDAEAIAHYGKPYIEIADESHRVVVLYAIEQSAFFQKIRGDLIFSLYNNKDVWPLFGYEGSSWEHGGYLNRGFNDIDWL